MKHRMLMLLTLVIALVVLFGAALWPQAAGVVSKNPEVSQRLSDRTTEAIAARPLPQTAENALIAILFLGVSGLIIVGIWLYIWHREQND